MFMGVVFGYLLYWSGSLWLPIVAHFTNNSLAIILNYVGKDTQEIGTGNFLWLWTLVGTAVLAGCMYFIYSKRISQNPNSSC